MLYEVCTECHKIISAYISRCEATKIHYILINFDAQMHYNDKQRAIYDYFQQMNKLICATLHAIVK